MRTALDCLMLIAHTGGSEPPTTCPETQKHFYGAVANYLMRCYQESTEQAISMVQNKLEHEALERAEMRRKEAEAAKEQDAKPGATLCLSKIIKFTQNVQSMPCIFSLPP